MDFWNTPLKPEKWRGIIQQTVHLREPEYLITSTDGQLQQTLRSFSIVMIGAQGDGTHLPRQVSWKTIIKIPGGKVAVQVELPQKDHMKARRALHQASQVQDIEWEGPFRSPASQGKHKRIKLWVYAPADECSPMATYILCGWLRKMDGLQHANIGMEELGNDPTAKILTAPTTTVLEEVLDLTQAALVLSPRRR